MYLFLLWLCLNTLRLGWIWEMPKTIPQGRWPKEAESRTVISKWQIPYSNNNVLSAVPLAETSEMCTTAVFSTLPNKAISYISFLVVEQKRIQILSLTIRFFAISVSCLRSGCLGRKSFDLWLEAKTSRMVQFYRAVMYIWITLCLRALLHCHWEPSEKTRNEGIISCTKEEWKMNDQSFVMQRTPEIFTRLPRWSTLYSMHLQQEFLVDLRATRCTKNPNTFR